MTIDVTTTLTGHTDWVYGSAISPDGRLLVSASGDHTLKIWQTDSGQELRTLTGHSGGVNGCVFSPDGRLIASASDDHTLKVWETESGQEVRTLTGHTNWVYDCAFSPDGRLIVSASEDHTLKIWEIESGQKLYTLTGHTGGVNSCAFSPDGRYFATAWDLAFMLPMLEMAGPEHIRIVEEMVYVYNNSNPISDHRAARDDQRIKAIVPMTYVDPNCPASFKTPTLVMLATDDATVGERTCLIAAARPASALSWLRARNVTRGTAWVNRAPLP